MVETIITGILIGVAVGVVDGLWKKWKYKRTIPAELTVPMSETDEMMIEKSQQIVREIFGDNVCDTLRNMKNTERVQIMAEFAQRLVEEYGLDIDVDIYVDEVKKVGYYLDSEKKAIFNINILMVHKDNELFEFCVRTIMETIIHELRHAVQWKTIAEEGFWNVDEERVNKWKENMTNYIDPEVDFRAYNGQIIEADANTFASLVMEGVA